MRRHSANVMAELSFFLIWSWGGEGNALPEGLIYEGFSSDPVKVWYRKERGTARGIANII